MIPPNSNKNDLDSLTPDPPLPAGSPRDETPPSPPHHHVWYLALHFCISFVHKFGSLSLHPLRDSIELRVLFKTSHVHNDPSDPILFPCLLQGTDGTVNAGICFHNDRKPEKVELHHTMSRCARGHRWDANEMNCFACPMNTEVRCFITCESNLSLDAASVMPVDLLVWM
jgi:hypothetical protein